MAESDIMKRQPEIPTGISLLTTGKTKLCSPSCVFVASNESICFFVIF